MTRAEGKWITGMSADRHEPAWPEGVWIGAEQAPCGEAFYRHVFTLADPAQVAHAVLRLSGRHRTDIHLNGRLLKRCVHWVGTYEVDLWHDLKAGKNVLAIAAFDKERHAPWVAPVLCLRAADGSDVFATGAAGWRCLAGSAPSEWAQTWFDDRGWGVALAKEPLRAGALPHKGPRSLVFSRSFTLEAAPRSARVRVSGLGLYELRINGQKAGDEQLTPGWTEYDRRIEYQTFEVGGLLAAGANRIEIITGNGWWLLHHRDFARTGVDCALKAWMEIDIERPSGAPLRIVTDASWQAAPSAVLMNHLYYGETVDCGFEESRQPADLRACVVHADLPPAGRFHCSEPLFNRLFDAVRRTFRGKFHAVPTDCPQRDERLGWMADAGNIPDVAALYFDVSRFFDKWVVDMEDAQAKFGHFPDFAPSMGWSERGSARGAPGWADAGVKVPWELYCHYGDIGRLRAHYPAMRQHVETLVRESRDGLLPASGWGDWLAVEASPAEPVGTAYFYHSADLLARAARALGCTDDVGRPGQLARVEVVAADLAHQGDADAGAHGGVAKHGAEQPGNLHAAVGGVARLQGVAVGLVVGAGAGVELDGVGRRVGRDGVGDIEHPAEAAEAGRGVPHLVGVFDMHLEAGVERRVDRVGLRRGVRGYAVGAEADQLGGPGDVIVVGMDGDVQPHVGADPVAQLDHVLHRRSVGQAALAGVAVLGPLGHAGALALRPRHHAVLVGVHPVHETHHMEILHQRDEALVEHLAAVGGVAWAIQARVAETGAGRVAGLAARAGEGQPAGVVVGQGDVGRRGVGGLVVVKIGDTAAGPHRGDRAGLTLEHQLVGAELVVLAEDHRAGVLERPAFGVDVRHPLAPCPLLPWPGMHHDVREGVRTVPVAQEPDVHADVVRGRIGRLRGLRERDGAAREREGGEEGVEVMEGGHGELCQAEFSGGPLRVERLRAKTRAVTVFARRRGLTQMRRDGKERGAGR
jgi:hypothetical protein